MLDSESLKPVILTILLYLIIVKFLPQLMKNKTNIKQFDDFVLYLESQKGNMMNGAVLVGVIAYAVNAIDLDMF